MATYIGMTVRIAGTFRDSSKALADATAVTLLVKPPEAKASMVATTKLSTGVYFADVKTDRLGQWSYKWSGNVGAYLAVFEGNFAVTKTSI